MVELSALKLDLERVNDGRWIDGPNGGRFRIARVLNERHQAKRQRLLEEAGLVEAARNGAQADDVEMIERRSMGGTVLTGWDDITDGGQPVAFSEELAETVMSAEEFAEVRSLVIREAQAWAEYRAANREASLGNSEAVSAGASSGDATPSS